MQAEVAVEIDGCICTAAAWLRNGDCRAEAVVIRLREWHDDVEAVGGAALEEDDELFFAGERWGCGDGALKECGHGAEADHGDAGLFEEIAAGEFEWAATFATIVRGHGCIPKSKRKFRARYFKSLLGKLGRSVLRPYKF